MNPLWVCLFLFIYTASATPKKNLLEQIRDSRSPLTEQLYGTVGAKLAFINKYPYTVSITFDTDQTLIGGGAILDKNWIVTSAYPLAKYVSRASNISIRAGSNRADRGGQKLKISQIITHERFDYHYWYNIALIKTSTDIQIFKLAKPIALASSSPQPGVTAQITGFGGKVKKSKSDGRLQVATVQVQPQNTCESVHGYVGPTGQCADAKGVGPCYSDFGNPLVYKNELIGFYLGGDICNFYDLIEVYSNVPALKSWIEDYIKSNSTGNKSRGINSEQLQVSLDVIDRKGVEEQDEDLSDGADN